MRDRFETFAGSVLELNRYIQKIKDIEMRRFGLRACHTMCLYYLGRNPDGLTATRLTDLCREDKAAISRSLSQLLEAGYVVCDATGKKRAYRSLYFLTDKGDALVREMNDRIASALFNGGNGLTQEQRGTFYDALELILGNLSHYLKEQEENQ